IDLQGCPPQPLSFQFGPPHTGSNAFHQHALLRLRHTPDYDGEESPHRRGAINPFSRGNELDSQSIEFVNHFQEVLRASCQSVKGGDENDIKAFSTRIRHKGIKPRTSCLAAGHAPILIFLYDREVSLRSKSPQVVELAFDMLVCGADTDVNGSFWMTRFHSVHRT